MIARRKKRNTLYMIKEFDNVASIVVGNNDANLWHNRLGHMSQKGMKELLSKEKLPELKNVHFEIGRAHV